MPQDVDSIQHIAGGVIDDVKRGNLSRAALDMSILLSRCLSLDPDAIILGCSELSAVYRDSDKHHSIIDPVDILVDACIAWYRN